MLDDAEMLGRLAHLYGPERAEAIGKAWAAQRERGRGDAVDEAKERYCRRMYNLSQFVKTLKERVSMWYNAEYGHEGCLWQGRFYSGVVEKDAVVKAVIAAYIGYNPVKAKIADAPESWKWSSYALAVGDQGPDGERCRQMYERMLGRPWDEVRATLESMFADKLPDSVRAEDLKEWLDDSEMQGEDLRRPGVVEVEQLCACGQRSGTGRRAVPPDVREDAGPSVGVYIDKFMALVMPTSARILV